MKNALLLFALLLFSVTASAAGRAFPQNIRVGTLSEYVYPQARIGGTVYRLAPGARLYDGMNRHLMPARVPVGIPVGFQVDQMGLLAQVWLLTPEEVDALKQRGSGSQ